jgi:hypothetical protein
VSGGSAEALASLRPNDGGMVACVRAGGLQLMRMSLGCALRKTASERLSFTVANSRHTASTPTIGPPLASGGLRHVRV